MKENMMNVRKDLVLEKNTVIEGDLVCINIYGKDGCIFDLIVRGDIKARNIIAGDIDAHKIICVSRMKKSENNKTIAFSLVLNRFERKKEEQLQKKRDEE